MYVWNHCMRLRASEPSSVSSSSSSDPLLLPLSRPDWCVSLVHGYFEQSTLSVLGRPLTLTLLSRRSRFYAGTRYLKRGVNSSGHAANDVETEQILHDRAAGDAREGAFTAYVTMRASSPCTGRRSPTPSSRSPPSSCSAWTRCICPRGCTCRMYGGATAPLCSSQPGEAERAAAARVDHRRGLGRGGGVPQPVHRAAPLPGLPRLGLQARQQEQDAARHGRAHRHRALGHAAHRTFPLSTQAGRRSRPRSRHY